MIIVDSSVWIDFFNGRPTPYSLKLKDLLGKQALATGDLILLEVLRGFHQDAQHDEARSLLARFTVFEMVGIDNALQGASYYRQLKRSGITIRKSVDLLIATFCIKENHTLLSSDSDFLPFAENFGLDLLTPKV